MNTFLQSHPYLNRQILPILVVIAFALVPAVTRDEYSLGVWTFILLNILVVLALDVLLGYTGQLSLGHGAFVAIGAYTSALLTTKLQWSGWVAMPLGMLVSGFLAALIAIPTLRLRGYYLAMATLGFPILFDAIIRVGSGWSGGSSGVTAIPRLTFGKYILSDATVYYYLVLVIVAAVLILIWNLVNTRFGLKLLAIHADESAAMARGINPVSLKIGVFTLSAAIAALSGSLYVHNVQFVAATTFGLQYSLMLVVMLVVGGMGRTWGGIVGVVLLGWLPELLRDAATWQPVIFGSLLALIMLFSPQGIAGLIRRRSFFGVRKDRVLTTASARKRQDLHVCGIQKRFGGIVAVSDLHFEVKAGEICSIIGPNGAGKSTALALISGAIPTDSGNILLGDRELARMAAYQRAREGVSRTFQHARLISTLTVFENVMLGAAILGGKSDETEARAQVVITELGLLEHAQSLPDEINHFARQLTELAVALAADPVLLLLDEPGAGLSEGETSTVAAILRTQKSRGTTILLVDHIMALVMPLSDRLLVLDQGVRIANGSPETVIADKRVQTVYMGEGAVHA
jgi:branched-chain amino acid transport system permease protein